jgi:hypothetical protein
MVSDSYAYWLSNIQAVVPTAPREGIPKPQSKTEISDAEADEEAAVVNVSGINDANSANNASEHCKVHSPESSRHHTLSDDV